MAAVRMRLLALALMLPPMMMGTALAQSGRAPATLTGKAAAAALIGNTLVFTRAGTAGQDGAIYFLSNGTVRFDEQSRQHATPPTSIRWSIQDDGRLCISEPGEKLRDGHCFTASITGDDVTISMTDRPTVSGKLLRGNARKL